MVKRFNENPELEALNVLLHRVGIETSYVSGSALTLKMRAGDGALVIVE